ncbi:ribonuclease P protein subunit p40-like isoform X2 [Gigantopelta aegis]|uniref:ribonuclease P protein subunit p40-like isoform X2 n=1 Tax=Gigantopelta aegis TaxID=1735272 RepID=UPI001B88E27B|nr:ribonuclease P protein subunit p40-like isoform X2 [Gigantopelta aegis]
MSAPIRHDFPASKLLFERSSFLKEKSKHAKHIGNHYFNYAVSMVLPGVETVPSVMTERLVDEQAFLVCNLPACALIDKEFIEAFVKKGEMYMLSHGTNIDTDNCVALLPDGTLVLNLTKDTYEQLGLEGRPSTFSCRHEKPRKCVVHVDMMADCFTPGKKNYDRVLRCLRDSVDLLFDFLVLWVPSGDRICPSTMDVYFRNRGYSVKPIPAKQRTRRLTNIAVPKISNKMAAIDKQTYEEIFEFIGATACGVDLSEGEAGNFITTLLCPEPAEFCQECCSYSARGFFSPATIEHMIHQMRSLLTTHTNIPWASLTVHGFLDSPVSWSHREHGFHSEGDNSYTFLVFPDQQYWLYSAFGSNDVCQ